MYCILPWLFVLSQDSKRGAYSSKKPALLTPQDKDPRRLASDFIKLV